jgi:hypothetical protein
MNVQTDFNDLLALFNKHGVEYLVVGAYALAFHGAPRFTGDIDVFVRPEARNAGRLIAALEEFGFGALGLTAGDFTKEGQIVQLGVPPVRIDLITSISGVSWAEADAGKVSGRYGDTPVSFLGRAEYVKNKRASGRKKDLADLEALGETE